MKCLCCGKETEFPVCETCLKQTELRALADAVAAYAPWDGENALWNEIAAALTDQRNFHDLAFVLAEELPSPQKEYVQLRTVAANKTFFPVASRIWLYKTAPVCLAGGLKVAEENNVLSWLLSAKSGDYAYPDAEVYAERLLSAAEKTFFHYHILIDYYSKTRRNDLAAPLIEEARPLCKTDAETETLQKLTSENEQRRQKPYLPAPKVNKDAVQGAYKAFLATLGIEVQTQAEIKKAKEPIPKEDYPEPKEHAAADFDSFVAFDLETTGRGRYDNIIEIGAVKVVNGKVSEEAAFCFQTFVKPMDKKISPEITALTGITPEDVQNAPSNKEALAAFLDFTGDSILLGFNCMAFDSGYLTRAGRYAHLIIENEYFDVMRYAKRRKTDLGLPGDKSSLAALAEFFGIENPRAHRALADAITTARVFLKLKEKDASAGTDVLPDLYELLADP